MLRKQKTRGLDNLFFFVILYTQSNTERLKMKKQTEQERHFTARVPASLLDEFAEAAKSKDETASQAVRKFMRNYIKQAQQVQNRQQAQA